MKYFSTKNMMLRTPYMVMLAVLVVVGVGTVYAAHEYDTTHDGNVKITGDLLVNGTITGQTIQEFGSDTIVTTSSTTVTDAIYDLEQRLSKIESHLKMTNTDS